MSGRKRSSRTVLPWLTARSDGKEGRFIQVGNSLLLDKRVQQLSGNAMRLYLCMAMESGGRRHFLFPQAVGKKYGICPAGLWRGMAELEEKGFLSHRSGMNVRQPNEYVFSLEWRTGEKPPAFPSPVAICSISPSE